MSSARLLRQTSAAAVCVIAGNRMFKSADMLSISPFIPTFAVGGIVQCRKEHARQVPGNVMPHTWKQIKQLIL